MRPAASALVPTRCELCPGIIWSKVTSVDYRKTTLQYGKLYILFVPERKKKSDDTFTLEYHIAVRVFCKSVKARPLGVFLILISVHWLASFAVLK